MHVLLVNLNRYEDPYPVYPLGLAYLTGALREAGHTVRIWDATLDGEASLEETLRAEQPGLVGLSVRNVDTVRWEQPRSFIEDAMETCRRVRAASRSPLVIGGAGFSVYPGEMMEATGADFGVQGEGEAALLALIARLETRTPWQQIPGLWVGGSSPSCEAPPARLREPDTAAPWHDPRLLRLYVSRGSIPGVQTQRGCPLRCCYCTYPLIEGKRPRYAAAEGVVAEFRRLRELGVSYVFIVDSVFNTSPAHVERVCRALIEADTGMQWGCFLRPGGLDRELFELMRGAGLKDVEFGSDSFSDPVLRAYRKSFTWSSVLASTALASEFGVRYSHFLILGGPGETKQTLAETIAKADSLRDTNYFGTLGMRVYPGTPLHAELGQVDTPEERRASLHKPRFHISPEVGAEHLLALAEELKSTRRNWMLGAPPREFTELVAKLRKRGRQGPLWEYMDVVRRFEAEAGAEVSKTG